MINSLIQTKEMSVGYDGNPVVEQIELSLKKGEILTIIGPNGAGKSTILKSITRQLEVVHGVIYMENSPMNQLGTKDLAKKLSFVSTERISPELMTCQDVVETGRYPYTGVMGILGEEDNRKVREALTIVQGLDIREVPFAKVSDGQRQKIMLARAICQEPQLLVLDEPTSYLDIQHKLEFFAILKELQKSKELAVLMSLHELDFAQKISDRVLCVKNGKVDRYGSVEQVFENEYIRELFDIEKGWYDTELGFTELKRPAGIPEIFVIGGAGSGIPVYRRLQKEGIPFYAGVLWENDKEYMVAQALATEVVTQEAFEPIGIIQIEKAMELLKKCNKVICTIDKFGTMNQRNLELLDYAKQLGIEICKESICQK